MKISWLSGRVLGNDLCGTTQSSLATELVKLGHSVNLYSPGKIRQANFKHIYLERGGIKGLHSRTIVRSLRSKIDEINSSDHILIDWRLHAITPLITKPWTLIDRGPPADRNFLTFFQRKQWKAGWRKASLGTAVSHSHAKYIHSKTNIPIDKILIVQAGVDVNLFKKGSKSGKLKLSYQGRVDKHRGVMALPKILKILQAKGITASLSFHGKGDALIPLQKLKNPDITITSPLTSAELAERQSTYDVGFLPMPATEVWKLASPLKRSEYLSSGMVVCGIDHAGHQISNSGGWIQLYSEHQFVKECANWLAGLDRSTMNPLQESARKYAEENLSWSHSARILEERISE